MIHTIITTSQGEYKAALPQSWHECSFELASWIIENSPRPEELLSKLSGITGILIDEGAANDVLAAIQVLQWAQNPPMLEKFARPDRIKVNGKTYTLPLDLGEMTYRFHVDTDITAREIDPEKPETILKASAEIVAGYLSELIDGKYSLKRANELAEVVNELQFGTVFGIANFFFRKKLGYWISDGIAAGTSR